LGVTSVDPPHHDHLVAVRTPLGQHPRTIGRMQPKRGAPRVAAIGAFLSLLLLAGCSTTAPAGDAEPTATTSSAPLRLLALGDSYTIGEGVPEADRWPGQLADRLRGAGIDITVDVVARTGWTTTELDRGIDAADPQPPYDAVTLLIGVNNQFRGLSIVEYRAELVVLLERAVGFAGGDSGRVIVISIPDWGATPFGQNRIPAQVATEIDAFNRVAREEATRVGAWWIDITRISRGGDPALVADDGLHPSAEQYRLWVDEILPLVETIIGEG
jgi:lysophospholipase L1-like esterase